MSVLFSRAEAFVGEQQRKLGYTYLGFNWGAPGTQASAETVRATRGQQGPRHGPYFLPSHIGSSGHKSCWASLAPAFIFPAFHPRVVTPHAHGPTDTDVA